MARKIEKDKVKITKEIAEELLSLLGIKAKIELEEDKESQAVKIQIETGEPGILIGYHGETLSALQMLLGIIVSKKVGEWTRIIVNIGDYRQRREEVLERMALSAAQKAKFSGEPVILPPLSAQDRRVIHLTLSGHSDVTSESEGEGESRRLVVKPKK